MITRSRAKAERDGNPSSIGHVRVLRKQKVDRVEHIAPAIYGRQDMGRRGGNSRRGTSNRTKLVDAPDVAPIRLFSTAEEVCVDVKTVSRVS